MAAMQGENFSKQEIKKKTNNMASMQGENRKSKGREYASTCVTLCQLSITMCFTSQSWMNLRKYPERHLNGIEKNHF